MHDAPTPAQLLEAVAAFLRDDALPALERDVAREHTAYLARVAANMLDIARRQLAEPAAVAADEARRLRALLGPAAADLGADDLAALNQRLAERIADGTLGLQTPGLAEHLWVVTRAKLAVDQPGYSTYRRLGAGP